MRANAAIVGVEKAGTTSLFRSLSEHPQVSPAGVKETRYFQPILYGKPLAPVSEYEAYFADAGDAPVRLEATPRYFYGGRPLAEAMREVLGAAKVLVVLREPMARLVSFFAFQQARLRIPESMGIEEYLARADAMTDADFRDPANHAWFGFRGGCYADWLPAWHEVFGADLRVVFFDDLVVDPAATLRATAAFLGLDPDRFESYELASENRTTAYRRAGLQRVALGINDRFERFWRRHYRMKERARALYYRLNGAAARKARLDDHVKARLTERYVEPNARLAAQLRAMGYSNPAWLEPFGHEPGL